MATGNNKKDCFNITLGPWMIALAALLFTISGSAAGAITSNTMMKSDISYLKQQVAQTMSIQKEQFATLNERDRKIELALTRLVTNQEHLVRIIDRHEKAINSIKEGK